MTYFRPLLGIPGAVAVAVVAAIAPWAVPLVIAFAGLMARRDVGAARRLLPRHPDGRLIAVNGGTPTVSDAADFGSGDAGSL